VSGTPRRSLGIDLGDRRIGLAIRDDASAPRGLPTMMRRPTAAADSDRLRTVAAEGRVTDPNCFDVNPGDWHIALVNMIGARKESFVIDAAETSEVWNHPVVSYQLQFYDATDINRRASSYRDVIREIARTPNLRHRATRSAQAKYVVGVVSTALITVETMPGTTGDENSTVTFVYDLELDANMRIVGGEWRDKARPDFIWRPRPGTKPTLPADSISLDMWRMGDANWRRGSLMNSAKGAPLRQLVEELFRISAQ